MAPGWYLIFSVVLFNIINACVKYLSHIPFFELVFFRALISISLISCWIFFSKISFRGIHPKLLFARGLAGTLALTLFFFTLQTMPLASAVTIQYMSPLFAVFFSWRLLNERISFWQVICFMTAFCGVFLVKGFDTRVSLWELMAGLLAAALSGLAYTLVRKLRNFDHPLVVIFYFSLTSLALLSPVALTQWTRPMGADWFFILLIGLLTTFAQYFMTLAYQGGEMGRVAIFKYVGVIMALAIGFTLFGEVLTWLNLTGIAAIIFAVYASNLKRNLLVTFNKKL